MENREIAAFPHELWLFSALSTYYTVYGCCVLSEANKDNPSGGITISWWIECHGLKSLAALCGSCTPLPVCSDCLPLSARRQHDLVDKVDDGRGGLLGVQLGEQVANVLCQASWLLGYEAEHPERRRVERDKEEVRKKKQMTGYWAWEEVDCGNVSDSDMSNKVAPCPCDSLQVSLQW